MGNLVGDARLSFQRYVCKQLKRSLEHDTQRGQFLIRCLASFSMDDCEADRLGQGGLAGECDGARSCP